jgi:hypothetical protein
MFRKIPAIAGTVIACGLGIAILSVIAVSINYVWIIIGRHTSVFALLTFCFFDHTSYSDDKKAKPLVKQELV